VPVRLREVVLAGDEVPAVLNNIEQPEIAVIAGGLNAALVAVLAESHEYQYCETPEAVAGTAVKVVPLFDKVGVPETPAAAGAVDVKVKFPTVFEPMLHEITRPTFLV
jgi:hypothetical protein